LALCMGLLAIQGTAPTGPMRDAYGSDRPLLSNINTGFLLAAFGFVWIWLADLSLLREMRNGDIWV